MRNYQDFLQIDCKVYNLNNITDNEALNKYPNECIKIFGGYNNV